MWFTGLNSMYSKCFPCKWAKLWVIVIISESKTSGPVQIAIAPSAANIKMTSHLLSECTGMCNPICQTWHNDTFLETQIFASVSFIYLKLYSVPIPMLYYKYFWVTRLDSKRSNTLALHAFLRWLILHVFNYTTITYGYFSIQSWDTD